MQGGGGSVLASELHGSFEETDRFVSKLMLAKRSARFGSFGTLVVHPAAMWAGMMSEVPRGFWRASDAGSIQRWIGTPK
jgi:O-acetylhomoserine/O-acetylserine sulfhydrylase-like pyridoxal-dependent enzyme